MGTLAGTMILICSVNVFCHHRIVDNKITFDPRLKVLGTWELDVILEIVGYFSLLDLFLLNPLDSSFTVDTIGN